MRVITLCHGEGNGIDEACLMTASNMLIGRPHMGDDNSCVCPIIRQFIIATNDNMPLELLGELYGDLAWEILGTVTEDREVLVARAYYLADWALRVILPLALDEIGETGWATKMRELPKVIDLETGEFGREAVAKIVLSRAVSCQGGVVPALDAGVIAAKASGQDTQLAIQAANRASRTTPEYVQERALEKYTVDGLERFTLSETGIHGESVATHVADAVLQPAVQGPEIATPFWEQCVEAIRGLAAIGDKRPQEVVLTRDQLCDALTP